MLHSRDKRTELFSMPLFMKETPFPPVLVAPVKVAGLAHHSAMTLGRVMNPVPARQPSCVHPVKHRQRPNAVLKQSSAIRGEGRVAAIKAHGQDSPRTCISLGYLIQFGFIDA